MLEAKEKPQNKSSKAENRKMVMRNVTGGKVKTAAGDDNSQLLFGFEEREHAVLECAGTAQLKVIANRVPGVPVQMRYMTKEGTAKEGERYRHVEGIVRFT